MHAPKPDFLRTPLPEAAGHQADHRSRDRGQRLPEPRRQVGP